MLRNTIHPSQRFAKNRGSEYNVFSIHKENAEEIETWLSITSPEKVLLDAESYETIKGRKMHWVFDENEVLIGCTFHE